jgi:hypothetical protein
MSRDKYFYNPEVKYYFLSVSYAGRCPAWIRRSYQTKEEIDLFLHSEYLLYPELFKNLIIYDESFLRQKIYVKNYLNI